MARPKKYIIKLSDDERAELHKTIRNKNTSRTILKRCQILLGLDEIHGTGLTHALSSLYKASPAPEARRIARRLEIHYTPKHGSWRHGRVTAMNIRPVSNGSPLLTKPGLS